MSAAGGQDDQRLVGEVTQGGNCSIEAFAWTYSSIVLRSVLAVAALARTSSQDRGGRLPKSDWAYRRANSQSSCGRNQRGDTAHTVGGAPVARRWCPGSPPTPARWKSTSTMPATSLG